VVFRLWPTSTQLLAVTGAPHRSAQGHAERTAKQIIRWQTFYL
jgi:hypothetical protein